eukprot:7153321-Prymnesium_polylepis.1
MATRWWKGAPRRHRQGPRPWTARHRNAQGASMQGMQGMQTVARCRAQRDPERVSHAVRAAACD